MAEKRTAEPQIEVAEVPDDYRISDSQIDALARLLLSLDSVSIEGGAK
ncbi:MAG: hypothetical protein WBD31_27910 [Rubripirellula sp.]